MINQSLLIFSVIIIYEFFKYIKLQTIIIINFNIYKKLIGLYKFKKASDNRKEKLIFNYSKLLFTNSIKIFAILLSILIFFYILGLLSKTFLNFVISIFGIIEISAIFVIYHSIRKKINAKL